MSSECVMMTNKRLKVYRIFDDSTNIEILKGLLREGVFRWGSIDKFVSEYERLVDWWPSVIRSRSPMMQLLMNRFDDDNYEVTNVESLTDDVRLHSYIDLLMTRPSLCRRCRIAVYHFFEYLLMLSWTSRVYVDFQTFSSLIASSVD